MLKLRSSGKPESHHWFEVFSQFSSNGKTLRRGPVTNSASGFPEQKLAEGVAGFSFVPQYAMPTSRLQERIGSLVRCEFSQYTVRENIRPEWLTTREGERLELDLYIPDLKIAFEIQGDQHYKFTRHFHRNIDGFAEQVRRDQRKRELCVTHGVQLIELASETDYHLSRNVIDEALRENLKQNLGQFLLHKCAQEVINLIGITRNIQEAEQQKIGASPRVVKRLNKKIVSYRRNAEVAKKTMRYICILGIQQFNGLELRKKRGWEYAMELRRQGKRDHFHKGRYRNSCSPLMNTKERWLGAKA